MYRERGISRFGEAAVADIGRQLGVHRLAIAAMPSLTEVAQIGAAIGREFSHSLLAAVARIPCCSPEKSRQAERTAIRGNSVVCSVAA
jgi:hypothetical protein